jgi:hypothetical protein
MSTLSEFLEDDHREIDALLARASGGDEIDLAVYDQFRARLLRHIGWEEKILFRAAADARGEPLAGAPRLRRDHGRIAALLTRRPTPESIAELVAILVQHNELEEGDGGVYAECDALLADQAAELESRMRAAPEVPLAPFYDGPIPLPAGALGQRDE